MSKKFVKMCSMLMILTLFFSFVVSANADTGIQESTSSKQNIRHLNEQDEDAVALRKEIKLRKLENLKNDKEIDVLYQDSNGNYVISASKDVKSKKEFEAKMAKVCASTIDTTKSFSARDEKDVLNSYIYSRFSTTGTRKRGNAGDSFVVDTFDSKTAWLGSDPFYSDSISLSDKMSFSGTDITGVSVGADGGGISWQSTTTSSTVQYSYNNNDRWNIELSWDGITAYAPNGSISCYMHDASGSHVINGSMKGVTASGYKFY